MRKNAAAPEIVMLREEDYPEELTRFLKRIRELDAAGGPHCSRVDRAELERYLIHLGAILHARHIEGEGNPAPTEFHSILGGKAVAEGPTRRQGHPPVGPRKNLRMRKG
jgi:hypothetical protein